MKLAIMQPYLFPYIGYFQLLNYVDRFILFDDVNFMKKKWINRNRILVNNKPHLFSVPLEKSSQNKKINDVHICVNQDWKPGLLKTLTYNYKKAPEFSRVYPVIEEIIENKETQLTTFILQSIKHLCDFMGIATQVKRSSLLTQRYETKTSQDRIIHICLAEKAIEYVNPCNGKQLYSKQHFIENELELSFISPNKALQYPQFNAPFVGSLSIIDVLMFNDKQQFSKLLNAYSLE